MTNDRYPLLDPKHTCACGETNKMYKNCCGKEAFVHPATGKPFRKRGCVRRSEFNIHSAFFHATFR